MCGLIFYAFCAVFAAFIFDESGANIPEAIPLGLGMNTLATLVGGLTFVYLSGCKAMMAGPDLVPTVFMGEAASTISLKLCPDGVFGCEPSQKDMILPTVR